MPWGLCPLESRCAGEGGRAVTIEENPRLRESREAATDVNTRRRRWRRRRGRVTESEERWDAAHLMHVLSGDRCRPTLRLEWSPQHPRAPRASAPTIPIHPTESSWGEEGVTELSLGVCPAGWGRDTQLLKTFGKLRHRGKWGRNNLWVIAQLFFLRNNPLCNNSFEAILRFYEGLFQDRLHCISRIDLLLCNYQIKVLEEVHFTTKPGWQKFCNWWLPKGQGLLWKEVPQHVLFYRDLLAFWKAFGELTTKGKRHCALEDLSMKANNWTPYTPLYWPMHVWP